LTLRPPPPAGSPELEALLTYAEQKKQPLNLGQLQSMFPFKLDSFQMKSVQQLLDGKSVVVCAPTGTAGLHQARPA
jgi:superfamily II RNA helicase